LAGALALSLLLANAAAAQTPGLKTGANTQDPAAPFFIDLSGLDFKTSPPTRDPHNPNYPNATELPDGVLPAAGVSGNFIIGPTHTPAPEATVRDVPKGKVTTFTMTSQESVIYSPGLVRDRSLDSETSFATDPSNLIVSTSHPGTWTRSIAVYVPRQLSGRDQSPFMVVGDGGGPTDATIFTVLDNLIAQKKLPPMIAVTIQAGGQDAQGSERGIEYDSVSGSYADFVEHEVLPLVERRTGVRLSRDPDTRATMIFGIPSIVWMTECTTGYWPARTWPGRLLPRVIGTSSYLRVTPVTWTRRPSRKPLAQHFNGCGADSSPSRSERHLSGR
jgi:hypothetical protein